MLSTWSGLRGWVPLPREIAGVHAGLQHRGGARQAQELHLPEEPEDPVGLLAFRARGDGRGVPASRGGANQAVRDRDCFFFSRSATPARCPAGDGPCFYTKKGMKH